MNCCLALAILLLLQFVSISYQEPSANLKYYDSLRCGKQKTYTGFTMTDDQNRTGHPVHLAPWAALLNIDPSKTNDGVICGGTLITRKHVVTAAHCFQNLFPVKKDENGVYRRHCNVSQRYTDSQIIKGTTVTIGAICTNMDKNVDCLHKDQLGQKYRIVNVKLGEFFETNCDNGNDIALLELEREIDNTTVSNHVCLPFSLPEGKEEYAVTSFGWGTDPGKAYDFKSYPFLQIVDLTTTSHATCEQSRGSLIPADAVCTAEEEDKNVCSGDSGGGIIYESAKQQFIMAIISYGTDCNQLLKGVRPKNQVNTSIRFHQKLITEFVNK